MRPRPGPLAPKTHPCRQGGGTGGTGAPRCRAAPGGWASAPPCREGGHGARWSTSPPVAAWPPRIAGDAVRHGDSSGGLHGNPVACGPHASPDAWAYVRKKGATRRAHALPPLDCLGERGGGVSIPVDIPPPAPEPRPNYPAMHPTCARPRPPPSPVSLQTPMCGSHTRALQIVAECCALRNVDK